MINQENNVPENSIAVILNDIKSNMSYADVEAMISRPLKTREWFSPSFYHCLPLVIGNQYGFTIQANYDFEVVWNGQLDQNALSVTIYCDDKEKIYPSITSQFGYGILTFSYPFTLRTPPGINLMTINPTNHILPNMTVLTGVVETDNSRVSFTFNTRLQIPNIPVFIPRGTPIAAFIPIPRYFQDNFSLVNGENIFSEDEINQEINIQLDHDILREKNNDLVFNENKRYERDKMYKDGIDMYGNKFKDHQKRLS